MKKLSLAFLVPFYLAATEYAPWYDPALRINLRTTYEFQSFSKVATSQNCKHYNSHDSFFDTGISGNYDVYALEIEAVTAATRHRNFGWDNVRLTGRYQFTDDNLGDEFSSTGGVMLSRAWKQAVHDIGSFHHGRVEMEAHLAIGKQFLCENFWTSRFWSVLALGTADTGSPWFRADFHWEKNYWDLHQFGFLVKTLWGFGGKSLCISDFKGYGPVDHQSVDLGFYYSYFLEDQGATLRAQYSYRVYAKNFPRSTSRYLVSLLYPW